MAIKLSDPERDEAIASLRLYSRDEFDDPLGDLAAGLLLDFFLEEIAPSVYNKALADAQARLTARVAELDVEIGEVPFPYWPNKGMRRALD